MKTPLLKTMFVAVRALIVSIAFIWLWGWVALWVRSFDRRFALILPAWTPLISIIPAVAGAILCVACITTFVLRGEGTPAPFDAPVKFVAVGPYRYVRNPMYIGGFLVLVGFALFQRSPSILIFTLVWLLLFHIFVLIYEEPTLDRKFGDFYAQYRKTVHRWLPHLPRRQTT